MKSRIATALALMLLPLLAHADLRVAATTGNMGMLARAVGGDAVEVTVMAPPDRDAHHLEARPSMMAALRRADLVVSVGAELEIGWLPAALEGANNRNVRQGTPGYFEAGRKIELLDVGVAADRGQGDVHPAGNPHFYLDPLRMGEVALALAERMGRLDSANAEHYRANAEDFVARVEARMPEWRERLADAPGFVDFHGDARYLEHLFEVPMYGTLEPLPGIPPTARHLRSLVDDLRGREGVITRAVFHPGEAATFVAGELDWPAYVLPLHVAVDGDVSDYLALIDQWVSALAGES